MRSEREQMLSRFLRLIRNEIRRADPVRLRRLWRRADLSAYDSVAYAVARAMLDGARADQARDMLRTDLAVAFDRRVSEARLSNLESRLRLVAKEIERDLPPRDDPGNPTTSA